MSTIQEKVEAQRKAWNESYSRHLVGPDELDALLTAAATPPADGERVGIRHTDGTQVRPSVVRFARLMEAQLRKNDSRGGWSNCDRVYFMEKLEINLRDLGHDLRAGAHEAVQRDCADLGNFAMMLAENEYLQRAAALRQGDNDSKRE